MSETVLLTLSAGLPHLPGMPHLNLRHPRDSHYLKIPAASRWEFPEIFFSNLKKRLKILSVRNYINDDAKLNDNGSINEKDSGNKFLQEVASSRSILSNFLSTFTVITTGRRNFLRFKKTISEIPI